MIDEEFLINPKADIQAFQSTMNVMKKYNYSGTFEIRGVNMTEDKIKEMLKDIVDNDTEYEFTYKDYNGDYVPWIPFKLGYEIRDDYEYRKVEKTWLEKYLENDCLVTRSEFYIAKTSIKDFCKKVLEEVRTHEGIEQMTKFYIAEIIKDLGVEV